VSAGRASAPQDSSRARAERLEALSVAPRGGFSRDEVEPVLARHADHPSVALVLNRRTEYFTDDDRDGLIAYRERPGYVFQFGGVFAPSGARDRLLRQFVAHAHARGRGVCAVQLRDSDVDLFHRNGFRLNQFGCSYTLSIDRFELNGSRFKTLRRKVHAAERAGLEVVELGRESPRTPEARAELDAITRVWLRGKGRHAKLIEFLVGEVEAVDRESTRCFVGRLNERAVGFITYTPSYGRYEGYMCDLTRRLPESPPGTIEAINLAAIRRFTSEGVRFLNFGLTPFVGVQDRLGSHSPVLSRLMVFLARHGSVIYPAQAQVDFKMKWFPDVVEPEFIAYERRFRMGCLWQLMRLTNSI